ncbi:MAG: hypothetical protein NUV77_18440 [Thermoguttaceae bacterium]|jgi:ribosome-associated translation inhibitor RaiA|nr:hypothetical protein [Thermoguttaceae bacterium]
MQPSENRSGLRVEVEAKQCRLPAETLEKMDRCLEPLRRMTRQFPVADLFVSVFHHVRGGDFHVKTSLVLMNTTLFTADHDVHIYPAFERCATKLVRKVESYVSDLARTPETRKRLKGTRREVFPAAPPDGDGLAKAVQSGDYVAFRDAAMDYEGPIRDRVARWIERYPSIRLQLGRTLSLDDVVEEVFLNAFERFDQRPQAVRFGEWLEGLIDPAIHALRSDPDGEKENIEFARTLRSTATKP